MSRFRDTSQQDPQRADIDRRSFLRYVGAGAAAAGASTFYSSCASSTRSEGLGADGSDPHGALKAKIAERTGYNWVSLEGQPQWGPVQYPTPLPGDPGPKNADARRLAHFTVRDTISLPEGFRFDVIAAWGDPIGPAGAAQFRFGFSNDYTGLTPIPGKANDYWLFVNHEDLSAGVWLQGYAQATGGVLPKVELTANPEEPRGGFLWINGQKQPRSFIRLDGGEVPEALRNALDELGAKALGDLGVSVLQVRRDEQGRFTVVPEGVHWRISGVSRQDDPVRPVQVSGPAAPLFGGAPAGTFCNCSGGTTPWGTFLTCEENIDNHVNEPVDAAGKLVDTRAGLAASGDFKPGGLENSERLPLYLNGLGTCLKKPLDGRRYGWVCEVTPQTGEIVKHTALGRMRHENAALRCEQGKRLAVYMGDDCRGGHVWKFVSDETVQDPSDPANSKLLEKGVLYAAKFEPDFTGRWIAVTPDTPLAAPQIHSTHLKLPKRPDGGLESVGESTPRRAYTPPEEWVKSIEAFAGKPFDQCTLGDLVRPDGAAPGSVEYQRLQEGVVKMDAFAMANAIGATPSARPEDLETHPFDHSVYIAFTDATGGSDGSPDPRIFPDCQRKNTRQYGAIYRLAEDGEGETGDPASRTFTWGKFVSSGETADGGGGFACADNLTFDPLGNLWMVTDVSTSSLNAPVDRQTKETQPGSSKFRGVFGNSAMFMIPTAGPNKGVPFCFATGPVECELTGVTFTEDGKTLIVSVQHPGGRNGARSAANPSRKAEMRIADRNNRIFTQIRETPIGSNFPSGELNAAPRPAVVCITRA